LSELSFYNSKTGKLMGLGSLMRVGTMHRRDGRSTR
jgi:hypothetical protein